MTDGKDGLQEIEGILQEKFVDRRTADIGFATFGNWIFTILPWVNIVAASGEQDSLDSEQQPGDAVRTLVEGNYDGSHPGGVEGGEIRRQGTLIVGWIAAGGLGNGNVN
jgi:hypothetical protein